MGKHLHGPGSLENLMLPGVAVSRSCRGQPGDQAINFAMAMKAAKPYDEANKTTSRISSWIVNDVNERGKQH